MLQTVHVQEVEKQAAVAAAKTEGQTAADEQARPFTTCESLSSCQAKAVLCNPVQDLCVTACQQPLAERFARCQATVWQASAILNINSCSITCACGSYLPATDFQRAMQAGFRTSLRCRQEPDIDGVGAQ